ncbi:MAG: zf-HC2 domain-containing protein [Planctomycetes bacterium]|nr:zf-HC2 domain-containing protein [Planctomycetota bacterium]
MTHPDDEALLDHALGLLAPGARAEVEAHLAGCAPCGARAQALRAEQAALGAALAAAPADARRVEARVLAAARPARQGGGGRRLLVAAGLGLVAGGLVLLADRREQHHRRATLVQRVERSERAALGEAR